jgi:GTPase SAR1 family protein
MWKWYNEFRTNCKTAPCILVGNKIDLDKKSTERKYNLAEKIGCPFHLVSAADGTNVVRVNIYCIKIKIFEELIKMGADYKNDPDKGFTGDILDLLKDV